MGKYDLSNKMGTILREREKFISLTGIRRAYSSAFSVRSAVIDAELSSKALDALNVVRNLIVHTGGIADSIYVAAAQRIPAAPQLALNEPLTLDGAMARKLIDPVIICGKNLLEAVDAWVSTGDHDDRQSNQSAAGA